MSIELNLEYYLQERFVVNAEAVLDRPVSYAEVAEAVDQRIKSFEQMNKVSKARLDKLITELRQEMAAPYN